jgi:hypothetical protein
MSRKLNILSLALWGTFALSPVLAGQNASPQDAGPQSHASAVAAEEKSPAPADKQTDKELIEQQKTCPVTDQPLGSMGKPVKVVVKGRKVFLCCAGCKKKFLANVDKYLKKLDEQKKRDEQKQKQ